MTKRSNEPFLWSLFSAGGVLSAMLAPVHVALFALAIPLGWVESPTQERLLGLLRHPAARIYLFLLCTLSLFHWAHRFRFTLYDGLQIKHLNEIIFAFCYGGALVGAITAGYLLWNVS